MKSPKFVSVFFWLFAAGIVILPGCRNQQTDTEVDVAVPVSVKDVRPGSIEEFLETNGTVYPTREVEISTEMTGHYYLQKNPRTGQLWKLGDRISAGEIIARIEDEEYVNSIQMDARKLNLEISKNEFEKLKVLHEKGGATDRELINAEQSWITSRYTYENSMLQMAKMTIKAPFDGVVVDLPYLTPGNRVNANTVVCKIMDYRLLYMEFQLPEKNLSRISVSQQVRILNYALPDDTLFGFIGQLSPVINPDTRNFKGVLTIQNQDLKLRPGSYVKAEIITNRRDSTIVIPKNIILSRQRGKTVYVIDNNTAMERVIQTGLENPAFVEVLSGLELNNRIVTEGFETLSNRSKVKILQ